MSFANSLHPRSLGRGTLAVLVATTALWVGCSDRPDSGLTAPEPGAAAIPAARPPGQEWNAALEAQARHQERLLAIRGVTGVGVGRDADGRPAIRVYLSAPGRRAAVPARLDGVPVAVRVTGAFRALGSTDRLARPIPIGVSTGNAGSCSAGTNGARVTNGADVFALSNNHVYALQNQAPIGSSIVQPGLFDTDCAFDPADVIGTLADFEPIHADCVTFGPVVLSCSTNNEIDAAIALTTTEMMGVSTPADGYGTPLPSTAPASPGQPVQKYGRTTQHTTGSVDAVNVTIHVQYEEGVARFVNQVTVSGNSFLGPGDSGSLLVGLPNPNPVGLLFAGNQDGSMAIANPIEAVLDRFGVSIDDGGDAPPPAATGTIVGQVTSQADGAPIEGATVSVVGTGQSDATDASGAYLIADVAEGDHTVIASASGFEDGSQAVTVTAEATSTADFALAPVPPDPAMSLSSIDPNTMAAGTTETVVVFGANIPQGSQLSFEGGSGPAPTASFETVLSTNDALVAAVTAGKGGPKGTRTWDAVVTAPDGARAVLPGAFRVVK